MNAVDARTGKLKWQSGSLGPGFGGTGEFYSTPAVAFGRVYAGNNDSRVYSFDISDGELAWSYSTGGYAYSGPAVASTRHTGPTVYIGSFDGNVYALNAKTGEPRWIESAGGPVIGSLTAVGEHRLRGRVRRHLDHRLRDEDRPPGLPLPARHLHAGRLRRPPPLPDRLLEHQRPGTQCGRSAQPAPVEGTSAQGRAKKPQRRGQGPPQRKQVQRQQRRASRPRAKSRPAPRTEDPASQEQALPDAKQGARLR